MGFIYIKDKIEPTYYDSIRLSSGQTAMIFFYLGYRSFGKDGITCNNYHVEFAIGKSRHQIMKNFYGLNGKSIHREKTEHYYSDHVKKENSLKLVTTGKCGLEGLLWAKKKILEFEKYLRKNSENPCSIHISGSDERRLKAYAWGLKKCGYDWTNSSHQYLYKDIIPKDTSRMKKDPIYINSFLRIPE
jgi:hypothetical protein